MTYLKKFRCEDCLVEWIDISESSKCYSCGVVSDKFDSIKSYVTVTGEMGETAMTSNFVIENWLLIVKKARKFLTHNQYEDWKFIVGLNGSPAKRAEIGEMALRQFLPPGLEGK